MKKTILAVVVVALVAGVAWWYFNGVSIPGVIEIPSPQTVQQNPTGNVPAGATDQPAQDTKTYSSAAYGFEFQYPAPATLEMDKLSPDSFKGMDAKGVVAAYIQFDNVVERFAVNISIDPSDLGACMTKPQSQSSTATIDGIPFLAYQVEEQVDAQTIITTVYRILRNTMCYEIRNVINSPNLDKLTTEEVRQRTANIAAADAFGASILQTFKFTR